MSGFPSIGEIKSITATITDLIKAGMTLEAQEKIIELREGIISLKEENIELREENLALKEEVRQSHLQLDDKDTLTHDGAVYWKTPQDGERDGPFCPACYGAKGKIVKLTILEHHYNCPVCKWNHTYS